MPPSKAECVGLRLVRALSCHMSALVAGPGADRLCPGAAAFPLLQEKGLDTVDANRALGLPDDCREYSAVAHILEDLGISSIKVCACSTPPPPSSYSFATLPASPPLLRFKG